MNAYIGSTEWAKERDALRERCCCGVPEAVQFLAALGAYVELWDDLIDKDKPVQDDDVHNTLATGLLDIAVNPWVQAHRDFLAPIFVQMISSYLTSEELAKDPDIAVRQKAFHLRNSPLEFYPIVAFLTGGIEHMRRIDPEVRRFFAFERFEEWEHADG